MCVCLFVFVVCCVGTGLCDELIALSGKSYQARACVCVLKFSTKGWRRPQFGC